MTTTLRLHADEPRRVPPTTTAKLARRMLAASRVYADLLPDGFYSSPALDTLLTLYVAEEEARYPTAADLTDADSSAPFVVKRWIDALMGENLVERRSGLIALTDHGYTLLTDMLRSVYAAQRALD